MRKLKIWNGRGYCAENHDDPRWVHRDQQHIYICAYSRADAGRVIEEYCGSKPPDSELKVYFSECWGNYMDGIEQVRGLWVQFQRDSTPIKVC
jgi:hypothetical protein